VFEGCIDTTVICRHIVGSYYCGLFLSSSGDDSNIITVAINRGVLELVGAKAFNVVGKEEEGCK